MEPPISVLVRRGDAVESVHRVHAAAVHDGEVVAGAGDPDLVTFMRSSAKPLQALPLARAYADLPERRARDRVCLPPRRPGPAGRGPIASRARARARGRSRVRRRRRAAAAGSTTTARASTRACSPSAARAAGKARATASPSTRSSASCSRRSRRRPARTCAPPAIDGCGVVTFALTLATMARAFGRSRRARPATGSPRRCARIRELIRGERAADTMLMRALPGWIAKGGAEGLMCAAGDGLGVALKAEDGAARAHPAGARRRARPARTRPSAGASGLSASRTRAAKLSGRSLPRDEDLFPICEERANIRSAKVSRGRSGTGSLCVSGSSPSPPAPRKAEVNAHRRHLSSRR